MEEQERRKFSRIEYRAKALLEQGDEKHVGKVLDLSLNGALIESSAQLDKNLLLTIHILLDEFTPPIIMQTTIVHHAKEQYGLQCEQIDIDSMLQLRTIIGMHTDDPNAFHRESKALWELKING
ncbi:MAG: PilZ domain-containing protein [Kangiellaceae bacterium]|nr:PilZ domain-containing protein [Kangiellaceae bacterium]